MRTLGRLHCGERRPEAIDPGDHTDALGRHLLDALVAASGRHPEVWTVADRCLWIVRAQAPFIEGVVGERRRLRRLLYATLTGWRQAARGVSP